jgi:endonuclease YncB( thermonuclease family)
MGRTTGRDRIDAAVRAALVCIALCVPGLEACAQTGRDSAQPRATESGRSERRPQPRPSKTRVSVPVEKVRTGDGDTIDIEWAKGDVEIIRILGIDTPETQNPEHNLPYGQAFGDEARGFAKGAFSAAQRIEVLRTDSLDPYGRSLGYVFVNGVNYSVLIVRARLAVETVSHYGDNGFAKEAAEVLAAANAAGPVPFEAPHLYRARMRDVSEAMKRNGRTGN